MKRSKYRESIHKHTDHELESQEFTKLFRDEELYGVYRNRILTIKHLVLIIMTFKTTIQRELDSFYRSTLNQDFNIRAVTKGAFSRARAKLKPEAFKHLAQIGLNIFYREAPVYNWAGFRLLAIDGSRLLLPKHKTIEEEFGAFKFGPHADVAQSMAMCSIMYDTLNLVPIDGQIASYKSCERDLLVEHLQYTQKGDLLLLDRGYPSIWLFFLLKAKGLEFCVRMSEYWWLEVDNFNKSDLQETIATFKLPKKDRQRLEEFPEWVSKEITVRLVKVELSTGETEILCTTLLDSERFPIGIFGELYHHRWSAEESFKMLKSRAELENFSGKTAIAVKQDFYAKLYAITLCSIYAHPIEEKVKAEYKQDQNRKRAQKINRTSALDMLQKILIPAFFKRKFKEAIKAFDDIVYKTREVIRPERTFPRNKKPKRKHYMNYKRL